MAHLLAVRVDASGIDYSIGPRAALGKGFGAATVAQFVGPGTEQPDRPAAASPRSAQRRRLTRAAAAHGSEVNASLRVAIAAVGRQARKVDGELYARLLGGRDGDLTGVCPHNFFNNVQAEPQVLHP